MTALWLFIAGLCLFLAAAVAAAFGVAAGFGGSRVFVPLLLVAAVTAVLGLAITARAFGFGWVGAP